MGRDDLDKKYFNFISEATSLAISEATSEARILYKNFCKNINIFRYDMQQNDVILSSLFSWLFYLFVIRF